MKKVSQMSGDLCRRPVLQEMQGLVLETCADLNHISPTLEQGILSNGNWSDTQLIGFPVWYCQEPSARSVKVYLAWQDVCRGAIWQLHPGVWRREWCRFTSTYDTYRKSRDLVSPSLATLPAKFWQLWQQLENVVGNKYSQTDRGRRKE